MGNARIAVAAAYAAVVLIWGTTWLGIKVSLHGLPPIAGAGFRFLIAGVVLYALGAALRRGVRRAAPPWHLVIVLALTLFGVNYTLTYTAETHLSSGLVAVLFGTMPFFIFALARAMLGERSDRNTLLGALVAFAGVALISLAGDVRADLPYVVAALAAALSSAYANVYLKRFAHAEPFTTLPPAMLLSGAVMAAYGVGFEHVDWHRASQPASLAALAYLACCGSAVAFYLNHWLLQRIDSGTVGLSALMIPVVAVAVGAVFGGEVFGMRDIAGALLVIAGVWLSMRGMPRTQLAPAVEALVEPHAAG